MKLDPRIYPAKRPLTCFDSEFAKQFIGKKGYFAEDLSIYTNLGYVEARTLQEIADNKTHCFKDNVIDVRWSHFLPEEWVKEQQEPKWRPFSLTEWRYNHSIGDKIIFRLKNSDTARVYMFCGFISDHDDDLPGKGVINLGGELFVLQNLFDNFELCKNDEWRPFGMEEE